MYHVLMGLGLAIWISAFIAPYPVYRKLDIFANSIRYSAAIAVFLVLFVAGPVIISEATSARDEARLQHTDFETIAELREADGAGVETRAELIAHRSAEQQRQKERARMEEELRVARKERIESQENLQKIDDEWREWREAGKPDIAPIEKPDYGFWSVRRSINPIDDSPTVVMSVKAAPLPGGRSSDVAFIARCQSNKTEAYIRWGVFVGDDSPTYQGGWKNVTIRLGEERAETQQWRNSTDEEASFAPAWAGNLLRRMEGHTSMLAQITPYMDRPLTVIFPLGGMNAALKELREACNW